QTTNPHAAAPASWSKVPSFMERRKLCGWVTTGSTANTDVDLAVAAVYDRRCFPSGIFRRSQTAATSLTLRAKANTLGAMTTVESPINLEKWIEENRDKFKPPVSNRYLYDGRDFFVMVIKGPNARNDFHLVDSEEYFYQLKGDIKVRVREGDRIVDHIVREGETFFIPPNVPNSPQRPPDTTGVVVERRRPPGEKEHVIFECENARRLVEDIHFDCADIVEHFSQAMLDFWNDDARRTCKKCGEKVEKPQPVKSL